MNVAASSGIERPAKRVAYSTRFLHYNQRQQEIVRLEEREKKKTTENKSP